MASRRQHTSGMNGNQSGNGSNPYRQVTERRVDTVPGKVLPRPVSVVSS
jgi:hypothetical protein